MGLVGCVGEAPDRVIETRYRDASATSTVGVDVIDTELRSGDQLLGQMTWDVATGSAEARLWVGEQLAVSQFGLPDEKPSGQRANELLHARWTAFFDSPPPADLPYDADCIAGASNLDEALELCMDDCCGGDLDGANCIANEDLSDARCECECRRL